MVVALLGAIVVAAIVVVAGLVGLVRGPVGIACLGILWIFLPTDRSFARRIALNAALGFGLIPLLWWVQVPAALTVGRFIVLLAIGFAFLAYQLLFSRRSRRTLLPQFRRGDLVLAASAVLLAWLYWPFYQFRSGVGAVTMLIGAYGGDDVGHFDMVRMIRRMGGAAPTWPTPPDGTTFAYVNYPQHFHVAVAFIAETWAGPQVGSIDREVGLFGLGTALVISISVLALIGGIISLRALSRRPALAWVAGTVVIGFVVLGLGSQSFTYGFPGFLFAVIGTILAVILGCEAGPVRFVRFLAVSALVILVTHSWSLCAPIAAVPWILMIARLPWRSIATRKRLAGAEIFVIAVTLAAVVAAVQLVRAATHNAGTPDQALGTPGAVPQSPVDAAIALALIAIAIGAAGNGVERFSVLTFGRSGRFVPRVNPISLAVAVGLVIGIGLAAIQIARTHKLSYFQYKYFNGFFLMVAVLLVVQCLILYAQSNRSSRLRVGSGRNGFWRSVLPMAATACICAALMIFSSVLNDGKGAMGAFHPPGIQVRKNLVASGNAPDLATAQLIGAAKVMATHPCPRPILLDPTNGMPLPSSNQWAMALSSTWTEAASPINDALSLRSTTRSEFDLGQTVHLLLAGHPQRCIVTSPVVLAALPDQVSAEFSRQLVSWGEAAR